MLFWILGYAWLFCTLNRLTANREKPNELDFGQKKSQQYVMYVNLILLDLYILALCLSCAATVGCHSIWGQTAAMVN